MSYYYDNRYSGIKIEITYYFDLLENAFYKLFYLLLNIIYYIILFTIYNTAFDRLFCSCWLSIELPIFNYTCVEF